jgi:hypothetical protein
LKRSNEVTKSFIIFTAMKTNYSYSIRKCFSIEKYTSLDPLDEAIEDIHTITSKRVAEGPEVSTSLFRKYAKRSVAI